MPSLRPLVASLTLALAGGATAQEGSEEPIRLHEQSEQGGQGGYQGVTPGQSGGAKKKNEMPAPPKRRPGRPTVTWIGFQALDGGSARVFVQSSHTFSFEQHVQGGELVVTLPELRLGHYNFQRFLDTSFFETPVKTIQARPSKRGVELHVKFKGNGPRQADARQENAQDGYHYLFLDFGAGGGGEKGR